MRFNIIRIYTYKCPIGNYKQTDRGWEEIAHSWSDINAAYCHLRIDQKNVPPHWYEIVEEAP